MALFKSPDEREAAREAREKARQLAERRATAQRATADRAEAEREARERAHIASLQLVEYRVHDVGGGDLASTETGGRELEVALNDFARSGWRLVDTLRYERSTSVTIRLVLERLAP